VGRLENIIARNRHPHQLRERMVVSLGFGAIILLILALMVFTDLGKSPNAPDESAPAAAPARQDKHVDGILLRRQPSAKRAP
jgi:hypothetical protein